ncbi:unnamed protein product [Echinostoma caproni]|uniref:Telo_bind domain-containing protein n=1 Tax=Echinostoma caproni TaxID=27848 RepID=A0A183A6Z5_9TREM|nr:unnamed protein product [Echinostoma caproni]
MASPGVSLQLVSQRWLEHHYDHVVWKLGCTALRFSTQAKNPLPENYFSPHHVLLRLRYRYDRELDAVERPALRRIVELDDTAARRLVLCVSELDTSNPSLIKARLSDGWYQLVWQLDPALARQVRSARIRVGCKLVTVGAELVSVDSVTGVSETARSVHTRPTGGSSDPSFGHLFESDGAAVGVALKLHGNSTRPVPWHTKLGFSVAQPKSGSGLYPVALCSLAVDGGLCTAIRVVIQRRYPMQYMETVDPPDGLDKDTADVTGSTSKVTSWKRHIFRSERAEQAEAAHHDTLKQNALDRVLNDLVPSKPGDEALPVGYRQRRRQPTLSELKSLGNDGEALFNIVMSALDPTEVEADLSDSQRNAIHEYRETALRHAVAEATPVRKVTPLLRIRVAGLHPKDLETNCVVPLTFWNPTDELLSLIKEGEPMEIYRLQVSTTRTSDPFVPPNPPHHDGCIEPGTVLSLSGSRNTTIRPLISTAKQSENTDASDLVDENLISQVYEPRCALSVADCQRLFAVSPQGFRAPQPDPGFLEVDLRCTVVVVHSSNSSERIIAPSFGRGAADPTASTSKFQNSTVDSVYVTDIDAETEGCLAVVKLWGGLQVHHLSGLIRRGQAVHFTDLQLRHRQIHSSTSVVDPETGLKSAPILTLHYTVASNVTADKTTKPVWRSTRLSESKPQVAHNRLDSHLDQLARLAESHWSSNSPSFTPYSVPTRRLPAYTRTPAKSGLASLLNTGTPQDTTPISRSRERPQLQTPTRQPQSLKQCLEWHSRTIYPKASISKAAPLIKRAVRSTPRTGLSRHSRPRTVTVLPTTTLPPVSGTVETSSHSSSVSTDCALRPSISEPTNPNPLAFEEDQFCTTPQPKAKRRRTSPAPLPDGYQIATPNKMDIRESDSIPSLSKSILEDTPDLLCSPVYSGSVHPGSPLQLSHPPVESSSPMLSSGELPAEDLDVSIADLVKTRRRAARSFQASSTPTRTKSRQFLAPPQ